MYVKPVVGILENHSFEERIPSSKVIYMRRTGEYDVENYKLMDTFKKWIKENNLYDEDTVFYAIPMDNPEYSKALSVLL